MNIQQAIDAMRDRRFVARPHWGHRCYVFLNGEIFMYSQNGYESTWMPSHPDLLAEDWTEVIPHP